MVKHEPEIRRAKARLYVTWCNVAVHKAPWTTGRTRSPNGGGIYQALELAEQALPYEGGLSKMQDYPPRRFKWIYDETGKADDCVKVLDTITGQLAIWPHWYG